MILQGFDVIAKAKTGTGKTMGFLLPTVELLLKPYSGPPGVRALAVSPTRELASQIGEEAEQLLRAWEQAKPATAGEGFSVTVEPFVGGPDAAFQLRGADGRRVARRAPPREMGPGHGRLRGPRLGTDGLLLRRVAVHL